jgi:4-nitrophenyl phosphatase
VKALFLDVDGTLALGGNSIGKAIETTNKLGSSDEFDIFITTNNTSLGYDETKEKLSKLGLKSENFELINPELVFRNYLLSLSDSLDILIIGTESLSKSIESYYKPKQHSKRVVLVGFDKELNYGKLVEAGRYLEAGASFWTLHQDSFCPTEYGRIPDAGSIAKLLELVYDSQPSIDFGKPNELYCEYVKTIVPRYENVFLVGDRLNTDISFGNRLGLNTVLVLTGDSSIEDISLAITPSCIYEDINIFYSDLLNIKDDNDPSFTHRKRLN